MYYIHYDWLPHIQPSDWDILLIYYYIHHDTVNALSYNCDIP